jgi:hypothetical protein
MSNRINKMKKSSKAIQEERDHLENEIFSAVYSIAKALEDTESISENGEYVEIIAPIQMDFQNKKGELFCVMMLATPMENAKKFGLVHASMSDAFDIFSDEDEIELTDEVIERLSTEGIDGEKYSKEKLLTLRSAGMTHYNTKRKSFVDTTEFIDW